MDWLKGMNEVVAHIEKNLNEPIAYEKIARIVGCSVYEFFRIFSFMTGMSVAEYIRRRRLSQAAFDIQNTPKKIIDIALSYCYESPTSFAKAFKDLHGIPPSSIRKGSITLKTYPPISFALTIKGVDEMNFRIEKQASFTLTGLSMQVPADSTHDFALPSIAQIASPNLANQPTMDDLKSLTPGVHNHITPTGQTIVMDVTNDGTTTISIKKDDGTLVNVHKQVTKTGEKLSTTTVTTAIDDAPPLTIAAFDYITTNNTVHFFWSADFDKSRNTYEQKEIPAADWAIFTFPSNFTPGSISKAYSRILTEWFPTSGYRRDESVPHLEKFNKTEPGNQSLEIWMPIVTSQNT